MSNRENDRQRIHLNVTTISLQLFVNNSLRIPKIKSIEKVIDKINRFNLPSPYQCENLANWDPPSIILHLQYCNFGRAEKAMKGHTKRTIRTPFSILPDEDG